MDSKQLREPRVVKLSVGILVFFVGVLAIVWWQFSAISAETATLDDATLKQKALTVAHNFGLKGDPKSEKVERLTLTEAGKLLDAELGKDAGLFGLTPEMPVFVYALRGEIEPTGPREIDPNNPNPKFDRMLIVLNAQNGDVIIQGDYYVDAAMPIALP
jgi:hypothetical protein